MIKLSDHFSYKKLIKYSIPTILMMIFTSVYCVVDGFFVSNFAGKTAFDALNFIKEGDKCDIAFYKGSAFSCEPQNFVELEVVEADPGIPGATAQPGTKGATLETGFKIQVPLFVNAGEVIRVDTRTGTYMSRV